MERTTWKAESEIDPSGSETSLRFSKHVCTYVWLALLGLISNPNNLNGEFNLPPAANPPPLPTPSLPTLSPPITSHS